MFREEGGNSSRYFLVVVHIFHFFLLGTNSFKWILFTIVCRVEKTSTPNCLS
jgi:hypothetical protein